MEMKVCDGRGANIHGARIPGFPTPFGGGHHRPHFIEEEMEIERIREGLGARKWGSLCSFQFLNQNGSSSGEKCPLLLLHTLISGKGRSRVYCTMPLWHLRSFLMDGTWVYSGNASSILPHSPRDVDTLPGLELTDFPCLVLGQECACDLILAFETGWKCVGPFHEKFWGSWGKAIESGKAMESVLYLPMDIDMSGCDARNGHRAVAGHQDEADNEDSRGERWKEPHPFLMTLSCSSTEPANYCVSLGDWYISMEPFWATAFCYLYLKGSCYKKWHKWREKNTQTICMAKC